MSFSIASYRWLSRFRFQIVVEQDYRTGVNDEYVIRGNSAILKCSIPSFLSDFVVVIAWLDDASNVYEANNNELNVGVDNYSNWN